MIQQQKDMRAHRRKVAQDLKNAKKKKQRLQKRARLLTTEDLLTVVALREKDHLMSQKCSVPRSQQKMAMKRVRAALRRRSFKMLHQVREIASPLQTQEHLLRVETRLFYMYKFVLSHMTFFGKQSNYFVCSLSTIIPCVDNCT